MHNVFFNNHRRTLFNNIWKYYVLDYYFLIFTYCFALIWILFKISNSSQLYPTKESTNVQITILELNFQWHDRICNYVMACQESICHVIVIKWNVSHILFTLSLIVVILTRCQVMPSVNIRYKIWKMKSIFKSSNNAETDL